MNYKELMAAIKKAREIRVTIKVTEDNSLSIAITKAAAKELIHGLECVDDFTAAYSDKHSVLWIG